MPPELFAGMRHACCVVLSPLHHACSLLSDWVILKVLDEGDHTTWNLRLALFAQHNILEISHTACVGRLLLSIVEYLPQHNHIMFCSAMHLLCFRSHQSYSNCFVYSSCLQPSGNSVTLSESTAIVSHGTTGLVTWDAALYLAEWAIENPAVFTNR